MQVLNVFIIRTRKRRLVLMIDEMFMRCVFVVVIQVRSSSTIFALLC